MCKLTCYCLLVFASAMAVANDYSLQVNNAGYEVVVEVNRQQKYHEKGEKAMEIRIPLDHLKAINSISINGHGSNQDANLTVVLYRGKKIILYKSWTGKPAIYYGHF